MSAVIDSVEARMGKDRGDENFPVGSVLIRADLRRHVHAFYAFARSADDIADSPTLSPEDKVARLDLMEDVLLGRRETGAPSAARLRESLSATGVSPVHSTELLVAFRQDATKLRYANWDELMDYCRYSAAPVGRHVLDLHGESHDTWPASDALCASLQVLNHLQDAKADLSNLNRCYLPQDILTDRGTSIEALRAPAAPLALRRVLETVLERVDSLNRLGANLPRQVRSVRLRLETALIVGLAGRLTRRLRSEDPIGGRVELHKTDIAVAALSALGCWS